MTRPAQHRRLTLPLGAVLVAAGLGVASCASSGQPAPPSNLGTRLDQPIPHSILTLPLTTPDGHTTTLSAYRGKVIVLGDSMTLCQEICPLLGANFAYLARQSTSARHAQDVQYIQLTIDPARDTPARLAAYRQLFTPLRRTGPR